MSHNDAGVSSKHSHDTADALEGIKRSFAQLEKEIVNLLQGAVESGKESAGNLIKERAAAAMDGLHHLKDRGGKVVEKVEERIEEHPLISVATAFAAGYLIARVFSRKK